MTYNEALDYLSSHAIMRINLQLDTAQTILKHLSLSQSLKPITVIQVAGTNGKGSTAGFLSSMLQTAGYRVGLFTTPHLQDIRETIGIDDTQIAKTDFSRFLDSLKTLAESLHQKGELKEIPTFFEYIFLIAVSYFVRQKVDIAILEVGMGGRNDATTAITPDVTVITNVAKDHTDMLGHRLQDIAEEKAGIIKTHIPVICGCNRGTVGFRVIKETADRLQAPFYPVVDTRNSLSVQSGKSPYTCSYTTKIRTLEGIRSDQYRFQVPLNGTHQSRNAAIAIKTMQVLQLHKLKNLSLTPRTIATGISRTHVPGRIETMETTPPTILDSSHNIQSTTALANYLQASGKRNLTLLFGVLSDKKYITMLKRLKPYIGRAILTRPKSERALSPKEIAPYINTYGKKIAVHIHDDPEHAYAAAQQYADEILITGSFYLVGAIRRMITNSTRRA